MRAIPIRVVTVLFALMTTAVVGAEPPLTLTVRLYNTAGIPYRDLRTARRTAESILRDAGLDVIFRQCGRLASAGDSVDPCDEPLKSSEVVIRVIKAPAFDTTLMTDVYGMAYVVKETDRGWLATVFADRVDGAAARVGVEPGTLLGRIAAHEVGHLLLGVGSHGEAGVMRGEWTDSLLSRRGDEWRFSMNEAARIHRALAPL